MVLLLILQQLKQLESQLLLLTILFHLDLSLKLEQQRLLQLQQTKTEHPLLHLQLP